MIKIFVVTEWVSQVPKFVLESENIYGITVRLPVSNFFMGDEYNDSFIPGLINNLTLIKSYGKKIAIGVAFGKFFPKFSNCRYLEINDSHHQGEGTPIPTCQPVFWDENYITRVQNFFKWFSDKLKESEVYENIVQVKITIANEKTEELKCSDQHWESPSDNSQMAFLQAAKIWDSVGYNTVKVKMTIARAIDLFHELFPDKIIALPVIGGLAGFPTFNVDGICKPKEREDLSKEIIEYGVDMYSGFCPEATALSVDSGTPFSVSKSGAENIIYQVRRQWYNPDPPYPASQLDQDIFQLVIQNGINNGGTILEIFTKTLWAYPNLHG